MIMSRACIGHQRTGKTKRNRDLLFAAFLTLCVVLGQLEAAEVDLSWTASVSPEVIGYRIHCTEVDTGAEWTVDAGQTTWFTLSGLAAGRVYRLHVRSYDDAGRVSGPSNVVELIAPGVSAIQLEIQRSDNRTQLHWNSVAGVDYQIWMSTDFDLANWTLVDQVHADGTSLSWVDQIESPAAARFYRVTAMQ